MLKVGDFCGALVTVRIVLSAFWSAGRQGMMGSRGGVCAGLPDGLGSVCLLMPKKEWYCVSQYGDKISKKDTHTKKEPPKKKKLQQNGILFSFRPEKAILPPAFFPFPKMEGRGGGIL